MAAANDDAATACANADCRVLETGRCVEGHDLGVCPYYGRKAENAGANVDSKEAEPARTSVQLPLAGTLTRSQAAGVLRASDTRVVAVIGPTDSGKTSLIASVYELFQTGPVGDLRFSR